MNYKIKKHSKIKDEVNTIDLIKWSLFSNTAEESARFYNTSTATVGRWKKNNKKIPDWTKRIYELELNKKELEMKILNQRSNHGNLLNQIKDYFDAEQNLKIEIGY